jgi:hypothetical protein
MLVRLADRMQEIAVLGGGGVGHNNVQLHAQLYVQLLQDRATATAAALHHEPLGWGLAVAADVLQGAAFVHGWAVLQAVMFADDVKVSKGMVKYACGIPKESIVDVEGIVALPASPIESATQKNVSGQT